MTDAQKLDFIKIEPAALQYLANTVGAKELPVVVKKNEEIHLYRNQWEQWIAKQAVHPRWCRFSNLFKVQGNDGKPQSLSLRDLQISSTNDTQRDTERAFVKEYGYPEAIIPGKGFHILRMHDGSYWRVSGEGSRFRPISEQVGKKLETKEAINVLHQLDQRFLNASPSVQLMLKRTGHFGSFNLSIETEDSSHLTFADKNYLFGNSNAKIVYRQDGETARYFLSQPQNGCVAVSVLNGGIFAGKISKDEKILYQFYTKLKKMQGSYDGRIDMGAFIGSIKLGEVPGLVARKVEKKEIEGMVQARKPVIAIVPYFYGHAFLITDVNSKEGYYHAVDTVSGMVVEEFFPNPKLARPPKPPQEKPQKKLSDNIQDNIQETLKKSFENPIDPEMLESLEKREHRAFFSIEIQDPKKFLSWVNAK